MTLKFIKMKNLIYFIAIFIFTSSCTSVRKLVDQGRYDDAIIYSIKKLQGKKNKKKKYVVAIEKAFDKVTKKDMSRISYLKDRKKGAYWAEIYTIANNIKSRQNRIEPLLPLISKDGYKARFKFVRVEPIIIESANNAADYYYKNSVKLLRRAENGNKDAAKQAYNDLKKIRKYKTNYKDAERLISKAYALGQDRVLIDVINRSEVLLPKRFFREIKDINTESLDSKWVKFYTKEDNSTNKFDRCQFSVGLSKDKVKGYWIDKTCMARVNYDGNTITAVTSLTYSFKAHFGESHSLQNYRFGYVMAGYDDNIGDYGGGQHGYVEKMEWSTETTSVLPHLAFPQTRVVYSSDVVAHAASVALP